METKEQEFQTNHPNHFLTVGYYLREERDYNHFPETTTPKEKT